MSSLGLQKVCDIQDFFDPEVDEIIRGELRTVPFGSRRAWEFAMIFRALRRKGKLKADTTGLAMGAGTERLIYAIASHAGKVVVTDLYGMAGGWEGVQTQDPKKLVMDRAPWSVESARIDVCAMDMRDLKFESNSFDFCWSTGAFEHIGDDGDFARHFREVHRVLRPGGVYAFTTAITFGKETLRIPHNHYFAPAHLIRLLHESPLHAEPVFECHVANHLYNRPHPERFQDYGLEAACTVSKPVVSFRRGALLAANVMVLSKDDARQKTLPKITGFDESCKMLRRQRDAWTNRLWKDFQSLSAELRADGDLVVQPQFFGKGPVELDFLASNQIGRFCMAIVRSRKVDEFGEWKREAHLRIRRGGRSSIKFAALADRIYDIHILGMPSSQTHDLVIRARRVGSGDKASSAASERTARPLWTHMRRRIRALLPG